MAKSDSSPPEILEAVSAAGVCIWEWTAPRSQLRLWGKGSRSHEDLEGDWQLGDFLNLLDGMSAQRLKEALTQNLTQKQIDLSLTLADGRELHFLGSFSSDQQAHGLLLSRHAKPCKDIDIPVVAVFQPIIRLQDGMIAGFEALARWRDDAGQLRPASSLHGTDERLLSQGLALAMLDQAGAAIESWTARYPHLDLFVQVNLSGADLYRANVLEKVGEITHSGRIPENALRIELTEQMALRDFEAGVAAAGALSASGASLMLDDFGSGHSSLAWLASIPAAGIKLDSQLTQLPPGPRIDQILESVTALARSLGMSVTAEGIEDFDRVQFLKEIGCTYVQGFAYAYPMEKSNADRFLENQANLFDLNKMDY